MVAELFVSRDNPEVRPVFDEEYFEIIPNVGKPEPRLDEESFGFGRCKMVDRGLPYRCSCT